MWNLRSIANVASILRTADCLGIQTVYFIGTTPHPSLPGDPRLPHVRALLDQKFAKTSLGAEKSLNLAYFPDFTELQDHLNRASSPKSPQPQILALEQAPGSYHLPDLPQLQDHILLIVGEERHGLPPDLLAKCNATLEIPMLGQKESLNVAVATGIALYALEQQMI
ncbi:hypothetical protein FWG86_00565 [Candidatus Saccharibacteria bacterium]|nr:hypothetical protein [Candidatus Saccharibacteria bacterium]